MENNSFGVNISGVFNGLEGTNEVTRLNALALQKSGIKSVLNHFAFWSGDKNLDTHGLHNYSNENPYPINLIHINYNLVVDFFRFMPPSYFKDKYNIGVWAWEMSVPPQQSLDYLSILDELWVPSSFCVESFLKVSHRPVIKFLHPIHFPEISISRKDLNLPEDKFLFLNVFNVKSSYERKNPFAVIKAFNLAFGENNDQVILVIKTLNLNTKSGQKRELIRQISLNKNIILIEEEFDKNYQAALFKNCDAYISLHRAEGFGLTMAEAMYYGKPTIATGYSGNLDFMNVSNSYLVDYSLVEDDKGYFHKGEFWAEPNVEDAALKMRKVFHSNKSSLEKGKKAAEHVHKNLSLESIGLQMKNRLEIIYENLLKKDGENLSASIKLANENYLMRKRLNSLEKSIPNRIIDGINYMLDKVFYSKY